MSLTEDGNQVFLPGLGNMVHSYMQSLKSVSAISYKINVRQADKQNYISLLSAIDVYD